MESLCRSQPPNEKSLGPLLLDYLGKIRDQSSVIPVEGRGMDGKSPQMGELKLEGTGQGHLPLKSASPRPKQLTETIDMKTLLREGDLYHNLDQLFRLIGEGNKSDVILEEDVVKALIYCGAQISSNSKSFAQS